MTINHAWIIDKDHIDDGDSKGITGPRSAPEALVQELRTNPDTGHKFRLYDDDDELYYEGRFLGDPYSEEAFAPLDDYGTPNAGATRIDYLADNGKWVTL
jgi:hypothetical protein